MDYGFLSLALGLETGCCYIMRGPVLLVVMSAAAMSCSTVESAVPGLVTVIWVGRTRACARGWNGVLATDGRTGRAAL